MDNYTAALIMTFIFFGWIPILATGKAIAWIIEACKDNDDISSEE